MVKIEITKKEHNHYEVYENMIAIHKFVDIEQTSETNVGVRLIFDEKQNVEFLYDDETSEIKKMSGEVDLILDFSKSNRVVLMFDKNVQDVDKIALFTPIKSFTFEELQNSLIEDLNTQIGFYEMIAEDYTNITDALNELKTLKTTQELLDNNFIDYVECFGAEYIQTSEPLIGLKAIDELTTDAQYDLDNNIVINPFLFNADDLTELTVFLEQNKQSIFKKLN